LAKVVGRNGENVNRFYVLLGEGESVRVGVIVTLCDESPVIVRAHPTVNDWHRYVLSDKPVEHNNVALRWFHQLDSDTYDGITLHECWTHRV
jgi:hypothetical protein